MKVSAILLAKIWLAQSLGGMHAFHNHVSFPPRCPVQMVVDPSIEQLL